MSKIVIPKHSADIDEMNAVLKIHYEADDWVSGSDFKRQLMAIIGADQYKSSYPKKAQVPAYFGFLQSNVSGGGKITERRITASGKSMYEAILAGDNDTKRRLLMEALEKMIFGRNNAGSPSSNSDIEPPVLLVKCILDTGYCTSAEYAYLVWALNDACKKYYESLDEIIKARSAGGIALNEEANGYKDWKPVLAMLRWGFLIKSDDDVQRVLLHPDVIDKFSDRLAKLKVYNIDKSEEVDEVSFDNITINPGGAPSYKPFKIDDENIAKIKDGHFSQSSIDIEQQRILVGDQVLFVNRRLTRLAAYYCYLINGLKKIGDNYDVSIKRQNAINRNKENELIIALKSEDKLSKSIQIQNILKSIFRYDNYDKHLLVNGHKNKDILPAYLMLRALLTLNYMKSSEQDYLVYSVVEGKETYTDAITAISEARRNRVELNEDGMQGYSQQESIQMFKEKGVFELCLKEGANEIQINPLIKERYSKMIKRLSFYAVDIEKYLTKDDQDNTILPKVIKAIEICEFHGAENGNQSILERQVVGKKLVQGDFIVFIDDKHTLIHDMYVYQIYECKKNGDIYQISYIRRHVINPKRQEEILKMLKEA